MQKLKLALSNPVFSKCLTSRALSCRATCRVFHGQVWYTSSCSCFSPYVVLKFSPSGVDLVTELVCVLGGV